IPDAPRGAGLPRHLPATARAVPVRTSVPAAVARAGDRARRGLRLRGTNVASRLAVAAGRWTGPRRSGWSRRSEWTGWTEWTRWVPGRSGRSRCPGGWSQRSGRSARWRPRWSRWFGAGWPGPGRCSPTTARTVGTAGPPVGTAAAALGPAHRAAHPAAPALGSAAATVVAAGATASSGSAAVRSTAVAEPRRVDTTPTGAGPTTVGAGRYGSLAPAAAVLTVVHNLAIRVDVGRARYSRSRGPYPA